MQLEFPYQVVTFLGEEPELNETVYSGQHGWYPQVALKRRFKLNGVVEEDLVAVLRQFFGKLDDVNIITGALVDPDQMPVRVIHITNQDTLKELHSHILGLLGDKIISRYPDREGDGFYAHITAEYKQELVLAVEDYENREFSLNNVWLLKDVDDENSLAYAKIK